MTKKKDKQRVKKTESNLGAVEGALTRTELWFEKNSKQITIVVGIIVVIVLGYFGYNRFIHLPNIEKAQNEVFMAERYFDQGEYQKALDGDEKFAGLLEIVDNYGSTKPGKLAAYRAGICYLNLGEYEQAIKYLKKYNIKDAFVRVFAEGAIGAAYLELGNLPKAIAHYKKAADMELNDVTTPTFLFDLGRCYELDNNFQGALDTYEKIRTNYPNSNESREAEKYIARVKVELANK
jgi:tetratricopeptide (TPR) repeat protein